MDMASRALVNNVGQLLTQLVTEEYRLLSGLRGDVTEVRLDLGTMHALLRMESEAGEGAADHFVGEWMNQLRELAYDAEDCVDLYKLRRKPRPSGSNVVTELWFGLRHWVGTTIIERRRLARQIRAIRDRAITIGERHARYGGIDRDALRSRSHSFAHLDYTPTPALLAYYDDPITPTQAAHDPTPAVNNPTPTQIVNNQTAEVPTDNQMSDVSAGNSTPTQTANNPIPTQATNNQTTEMPMDNQTSEVSVGNPIPTQTANNPMPMQTVDNPTDNPTLTHATNNPTPIQATNNLTPTQVTNNQTSRVPTGNQTFEVPAGNRTQPNNPDHSRHYVDVGGYAKDLTQKLTDETDTFKVVFVVGFGGVGKTTLAMEVCHRLETEFPYQAMVSVSQAFEPSTDAVNKLLESICDKIVKLRSNDSREVINQGNLGKYLSDKRYLIVIDDVWTVHAWEAIQLKLQALRNNCGSRILVTTRIRRVAEVFSSDIYPMKALEKEDSKKLFCKKVFGSTKDDVCPRDLVHTMNNIIEKCGGMALAIVSIASILESYKSNGDRDKWEKVYKSIGSDLVVGNNPQLERMRHIVALSYNHLPHELKGCMMYLSIFPEDFSIDKKRLLSRWIAEGLVPKKRGWTQMEVAEAYFDELVSRNMVIPHYGDDDEKVESCRVHDILLEILVSKSLECNFVSLLRGQHVEMRYDRIRRLSIQEVAQEEEENKTPGEVQPKKNMTGGGNIKGMDVEHVRSLSMFKVKEHELLKDLKKFTLLRVLDLEGYQGLTKKQMDDVCEMRLLRFLSIKGTKVEKMPKEVENLVHLQTLDVSDTTLGGLPDTVTELVKLERILFKHKEKWDTLWKLRPGIKKMKALRELHLARLDGVDAQQVAEELGELQNLQHIGIYIFCRDNEVSDETLASFLSKQGSLQHLNISRIGGSLNFLNGMSTPRQLRLLRLEGDLGGSLPGWVRSLTCLVKIVMRNTKLTGDHLFDDLSKLKNLKTIVMEQDCYVGKEIVARPQHKFPALTQLIASSELAGNRLKKFEFQAGSMEKLEMLCIKFGEQWRKIVGIRNLTKLKEVILVGTNNNDSLRTADAEAKEESNRRRENREHHFRVSVTYYLAS